MPAARERFGGFVRQWKAGRREGRTRRVLGRVAGKTRVLRALAVDAVTVGRSASAVLASSKSSQ
jgi:hypothetical protein